MPQHANEVIKKYGNTKNVVVLCTFKVIATNFVCIFITNLPKSIAQIAEHELGLNNEVFNTLGIMVEMVEC